MPYVETEKEWAGTRLVIRVRDYTNVGTGGYEWWDVPYDTKKSEWDNHRDAVRMTLMEPMTIIDCQRSKNKYTFYIG